MKNADTYTSHVFNIHIYHCNSIFIVAKIGKIAYLTH